MTDPYERGPRCSVAIGTIEGPPFHRGPGASGRDKLVLNPKPDIRGQLFCCNLAFMEASMGADGEEDITYRGYCPSCGCEREIYRTVPWQADFCTECGQEIEEVSPESR